MVLQDFRICSMAGKEEKGLQQPRREGLWGGKEFGVRRLVSNWCQCGGVDCRGVRRETEKPRVEVAWKGP